jgi:hypothetical protein
MPYAQYQPSIAQDRPGVIWLEAMSGKDKKLNNHKRGS